MKTPFTTHRLAESPDAIAPDGSEVRILARLAGGSMAHFRLPAGAVSRAVVHRTVEEVWYFVGGRGRMWRHDGEREEIVEALPGVSSLDSGRHALPVPRRRRRSRSKRWASPCRRGRARTRPSRPKASGRPRHSLRQTSSVTPRVGLSRWLLPGGGHAVRGGERIAGFEQALQAGEDLRPAVGDRRDRLRVVALHLVGDVSLTASSWLAISKVQRPKPSALSSGRNSFRHLRTSRFPGSASTISPVSVIVPSA